MVNAAVPATRGNTDAMSGSPTKKSAVLRGPEAWKDREYPNTIVLFDVDGTLSPSRKVREYWRFADRVFKDRKQGNSESVGKTQEEGSYWICWRF
jgi:hypothetical protein